MMYSELVGDCEGSIEDPNTDRIEDSKLSSGCFTGEQGLCQELDLKIFMLHSGGVLLCPEILSDVEFRGNGLISLAEEILR